MVTTCAVVGCNSSWNPFTGVSFFRITTNKKLLLLWQQVVKLNTSENGKICSLHFKDNDFVDSTGEKRLKRLAVPSLNILDKASMDDGVDDDDDDNKNLSVLKQMLKSKHTDGHEHDGDGNEQDTGKRPAEEFEMVMHCCNSVEHPISGNIATSKQTRDTGSQVSIKTDREVSLQSRVKLLNLRLQRRDAKISYMKTVFNMIKKHVKGTDMEYKLCCELENISKLSEQIQDMKKNADKKCVRTEIPISDHHCEDEINDDLESSGDEAGSFVEVILSPNLRVCNGS